LGQVPQREGTEGWDLMTTEDPPNRGDVPHSRRVYNLASVFQVLVLGSWVAKTGRKKIGQMDTAKPNQKDLVLIKELLEAGKVISMIDCDQRVRKTPHVVSLLAALSVADGLVYGQCHTRKRFIDFRIFLETVVVPEARSRRVQTIALVKGNGSTHASKQLPCFVKELMATSEGKLTIQLYWLPTNASWLDQIEIWFSLLQRKLLQPNHFTSRDDAAADYPSFHCSL
jgi:DDE superfamily endonuclease